MKEPSLLLLITGSAYGHSAGIETLDIALSAASLDYTVSLVFIYNGVYQLISQQSAESYHIKQYTKTYRVLADFGIHNIYVHQPSVWARDLDDIPLLVQAQSVDNRQVADLIQQNSRLITL